MVYVGRGGKKEVSFFFCGEEEGGEGIDVLTQLRYQGLWRRRKRDGLATVRPFGGLSAFGPSLRANSRCVAIGTWSRIGHSPYRAAERN